MEEFNYFKIGSDDKSKPIYRITLGELIPEEDRKTHPTKQLYDNLSGEIGFIDYTINQSTLEILLIGIEPEFKGDGYKKDLIKEAASCAKANKLRNVIHYNETLYTKKEIKKL